MEEKGYTVTFKVEGGEDRSVFAAHGESLLDAAKKANIALDAPCSGNGTCGKCRVKLLEGETEGPFTLHISQEEYQEGFRLACGALVRSEALVAISSSALAYQNRIKVSGKGAAQEGRIVSHLQTELKAMALGGDLGLKTLRINLSPPNLEDAMADKERLIRGIEEAIQQEEPRSSVPTLISLHALRKLPHALREADFSLTAVIRQEERQNLLLNVFPGKSADSANAEAPPLNAGLAIDIGTTTISMALVNLDTGELLTIGSAGNGQIRYGADVINRIIESVKPQGLERLRRAVTQDCIEPLILSICQSLNIAPETIYRVTVAANTTMIHLFMGVSPEFVRLEPYVPAFFETADFRGADLGLPVHPDAEIVLAPNIGSYVGGDITAGVFASMIFKKESLSLFIDLGTNGELVFGNSEFLMACACSAGPAFEGGDISCGMRATDGAIEACRIDADTLDPAITVIGAGTGQKPAGLCGSGIIDLIGELFRCGIINARGKIVAEGRRIRRDPWGQGSYIIAFASETETGFDVALSESDIDNFIRAKGAIFSAIRTMLKIVDFPVDAIEDVYVAGGIGSGINMAQAIRIGMFPNLDLEKYHYIGNSSQQGAYAMLISRKARAMVSEISRGMTYLELSSHPGYMDEFVAACFLPHTDASLFVTA